MKHQHIPIVMALAAVFALGCGGGSKRESTTPTGGDEYGEGAQTGTTDSETDAGAETTAEAKVPAGDASRGATVYEDSCAMCHGDDGEGSKKTPALVGANALADFSDDDALFAYLKEKMPKDEPGTLTDQQYADVLAWLRSK